MVTGVVVVDMVLNPLNCFSEIDLAEASVDENCVVVDVVVLVAAAAAAAGGVVAVPAAPFSVHHQWFVVPRILNQ